MISNIKYFLVEFCSKKFSDVNLEKRAELNDLMMSSTSERKPNEQYHYFKTLFKYYFMKDYGIETSIVYILFH